MRLNKEQLKIIEEDMLEIEEPPCTKGGKCEYFDKCSNEALACLKFVAYVANKKLEQYKIYQRKGEDVVRTPTRKLYLKMVSNED